MQTGLTPTQTLSLIALMNKLVPGDDLSPAAGDSGGAEYVNMLLTAFDYDPPHIWAGGPFSGRHGGAASFENWLELGPWEILAWKSRIEDLNNQYHAGLDSLGPELAEISDEFRELVFTHACEALYGDPVYGGNREMSGWLAIDYRGDSQPSGYSDQEVSAP
ncbi:Gluconate 2-dehydrogenase subunit 3 [Actinobacteria bacterium IMCC26207]|nr:Gluconate 2-dehydrogenase subunit 3 [Actinobacteria bacterium IMCC26207]